MIVNTMFTANSLVKPSMVCQAVCMVPYSCQPFEKPDFETPDLQAAEKISKSGIMLCLKKKQINCLLSEQLNICSA